MFISINISAVKMDFELAGGELLRNSSQSSSLSTLLSYDWS